MPGRTSCINHCDLHLFQVQDGSGIYKGVNACIHGCHQQRARSFCWEIPVKSVEPGLAWHVLRRSALGEEIRWCLRRMAALCRWGCRSSLTPVSCCSRAFFLLLFHCLLLNRFVWGAMLLCNCVAGMPGCPTRSRRRLFLGNAQTFSGTWFA